MFNEGISYTGDLVNLGTKYGIITKAGAWFGYGGENIAQGKEAAKAYLKEHKDVAQKIKKEILEKSKNDQVISV
jgi:recombination protein RecA